MSVEEAQQIAVQELQNQMSAMQAALEGTSQASCFKQNYFIIITLNKMLQ